MSYAVYILRRAQKELARLPSGDFNRIRDTIRGLSVEARPTGCIKLTGRDGWRVRVGNYRLLYEIDDRQGIVTVLHIGHRRDVYR